MPGGWPIRKVVKGGIKVTEAANGRGVPYVESARGVPVTFVASGGIPLRSGAGVVFPQTAAILGAGGLDYAFFDSGLAASMFQDAAGTTPAAQASPVGRWNVRQKAPHFASQSVGGSRPVLQANGLTFDVLDDNLLADWLTQAGANSLVAQVTVPAVIGATQFLSGSAANSFTNNFFIGFATSGQIRFNLAGMSTTNVGSDYRGQTLILGMSADGNSKVFAGTEEVYAAPQSGLFGGSVPVRIGCLNNDGVAANFFGGSIKRIAFGKTALTLEQYQTIRAEWLAVA